MKKQINANAAAVEALRSVHVRRNEWMFEHLLKNGMEIKSDNYAALHACIDTGNVGAAKLLLDQSMSFDEYMEWAKNRPPSDSEALSQVEEYWDSLSQPEQTVGITMGGM